jgi:hypothetical protein
MKWKYVVAWLPGVLIAIANGIIRQFVYRAYLDELPAHQVSVVSFIVLFGLYVWFIIPWLRLTTAVEAIRVGLVWFGLTVLFEFVFGHFVMGHPWSALLHDYNVLEGRLWVVVLLWTTIAPLVVYRLRTRNRPPGA